MPRIDFLDKNFDHVWNVFDIKIFRENVKKVLSRKSIVGPNAQSRFVENYFSKMRIEAQIIFKTSTEKIKYFCIIFFLKLNKDHPLSILPFKNQE